MAELLMEEAEVWAEGAQENGEKRTKTEMELEQVVLMEQEVEHEKEQQHLVEQLLLEQKNEQYWWRQA